MISMTIKLNAAARTPAKSTRLRRENLTRVHPSSAPLLLDSMMHVNTECDLLDSRFMLVSPIRRFSVPLRITFKASSTAQQRAYNSRLPLQKIPAFCLLGALHARRLEQHNRMINTLKSACSSVCSKHQTASHLWAPCDSPKEPFNLFVCFLSISCREKSFPKACRQPKPSPRGSPSSSHTVSIRAQPCTASSLETYH